MLAVTSPGAEHSLQGTQASAAVVHGPCCPLAHESFPDRESNLCPLLWHLGSSPLGHQGSAFTIYIFFLIFILCICLAVLSLHCSTRNQSLLQCAISAAACGFSSPTRDETQPPALRARRNLAAGPPGKPQFQCILPCATITPHLVSDIFHHPQQS